MTHHALEYTHNGFEYSMEVVDDFKSVEMLQSALINYLLRTDSPSTQGFVNYVRSKGQHEIYSRGEYEDLTGKELEAQNDD